MPVQGQRDQQRSGRQQKASSSVLLIDDDKDVLIVLKRSLELKCMNMYGFTNPILAVEHFRNNAANYDIVVTSLLVSKYR